MVAQLPHEVAYAAGAEHQFVAAVAQRLEELPLEIAGERGHGADAEGLARFLRTVAERVDEFVPGAEDGIGVLQGDASGFGEDKFAVLAHEQRMAEVLSELAELGAEGGLGHVQARGGFGQAALVRDGPEVGRWW